MCVLPPTPLPPPPPPPPPPAPPPLPSPCTQVFDQALAGGGAKSINFQDLAADLAQITFDYPFRIPPYFALVIRAIGGWGDVRVCGVDGLGGAPHGVVGLVRAWPSRDPTISPYSPPHTHTHTNKQTNTHAPNATPPPPMQACWRALP